MGTPPRTSNIKQSSLWLKIYVADGFNGSMINLYFSVLYLVWCLFKSEWVDGSGLLFWDCACVCWSLCSHLFEDSLVAKSEQSKSSMVSVTRLIWFHLLLGLASQFSVYLPRPGHTTDNLSYQPNAENWHCKAQAVPANCEKLLSKFVHTSIRRDSFNSLFGIPSILKQCQVVMYPQKMICDIILQILLDFIAIFL